MYLNFISAGYWLKLLKLTSSKDESYLKSAISITQNCLKVIVYTPQCQHLNNSKRLCRHHLLTFFTAFIVDFEQLLTNRYASLSILGLVHVFFNVPIMEKPGGWFLSAKCMKNTSGRVAILGPASLLKMSPFHRCFSHILPVKTNYLVSQQWEHWLILG